MTPGPWTKCGSKVMHGPGGTLHLCECNIVESEQDKRAPITEAFTNARAIAALPDLLQSMQNCRELLRQLVSLSNLNEETRTILQTAGNSLNEALQRAGCVTQRADAAAQVETPRRNT